MLKQRRNAADQVAECLFSAEAAIDAALAKTAVLAAALPAARAEAELSAVLGQEVVERLSETISAIAQARRGIVETHKELAAVSSQIGLGAVAFGGGGHKPPALAEGFPLLHPLSQDAA